MIFSPMRRPYCECGLGGQSEVEHVKPLAHFAAELLSEQQLDIRLVIDNQHPYGHGTGPSRFGATLGHSASWPCFPLAGQDRTVGCQRVRMLSPAKASIQTFLGLVRLTGWF